MMMFILAYLIVALIAWMWASRGFLSALLHMVCVVAAGAVAFGAWKPVTALLYSLTENDFIEKIGPGLALILPFALALGLLRFGVDRLIPGNAQTPQAADFIGGGICGLVSGVLAVGMWMIGIGFMQVGEAPLGYKPIEYQSNGSIERSGYQAYGPDRFTAQFYDHLSMTTMRTATPLALEHPDVELEGPLLRMSFNKGTSHVHMRPDDFKVLGRYTVGKGDGLTPKDLLADSFAARTQTRTMLDGSTVSGAHYLEGYVVRFGGKGREERGQIIFGVSQTQLIVTRGSESLTLLPVAMISQAEGDSLIMGRWPFDSKDLYIPSVGGATQYDVVFEFFVPEGYTPRSLYIKGAQADADEVMRAAPYAEYSSARARDNGVRTGTMMTELQLGADNPIEDSLTQNIRLSSQSRDNPISVRSSLPRRMVINKGQPRGLSISDRQRVIAGEAQFTTRELIDNNKADLALRVMSIEDGGEDTRVVQIDLGNESQLSVVNNRSIAAGDLSDPPILVDDKGQRYQAVGFTYRDDSIFEIKVTPNDPVMSMDELPSLSRSTPDRELYLVFRVSRGVKITEFRIGNRIVAKFSPPLDI